MSMVTFEAIKLDDLPFRYKFSYITNLIKWHFSFEIFVMKRDKSDILLYEFKLS